MSSIQAVMNMLSAREMEDAISSVPFEEDEESSPSSVTQLRKLDTSKLKVDTKYKAGSTAKQDRSPVSELTENLKRRKSLSKIAARLGVSETEAHSMVAQTGHRGSKRNSFRRGSVEKMSRILGVDLHVVGKE